MNIYPRTVLAFFGAMLLGAGCSHRRPSPALAAPMGLQMDAVPLPSARSMAIQLPVPRVIADLSWLDLDEFYPPGATRFTPASSRSLELFPERRTRFPTVELCASPDGAVVLFHDGMKRDRQIYHWLMLLKKEAAYPSSIFCTPMAFDTSWSEDSQRFAVTHYIGKNSSEVFVVGTDDLVRRQLEIRSAVGVYLPEHMIMGSMFIKAYRWTRDGHLVLRSVAVSELEPYDQFGFEILADFSEADADPKSTFLRGYVVRQAAPASVAPAL